MLKEEESLEINFFVKKMIILMIDVDNAIMTL